MSIISIPAISWKFEQSLEGVRMVADLPGGAYATLTNESAGDVASFGWNVWRSSGLHAAGGQAPSVEEAQEQALAKADEIGLV